MNASYQEYFVLIIPSCLLLLGLAFLVCRFILRGHNYLSWIAAGYIIPAFTLAAHSLMDNQQLARWAVVASAGYLLGIWAVARGLALRHNGTAHPKIALAMAAVILSLQFYYSQINDQLWLRIIVLNSGILLMQLTVARQFFSKALKGDKLDKTLAVSYIAILCYSFMRPIVIGFNLSIDTLGQLTQSNYWLLMLAVSMLLSLWLALLIFAITVRDIVLKINDERYRDSLTQLLNRRGFFEAAKHFVQSDLESKYFLLTCDIDHFKSVNDTWGHQAGDKVLQSVSKTIMKNVRKGDLVARFGGEEFVVFLRSSSIEDAQKIAERIRHDIETTTYTAIPDRVTASFGLVDIAHSNDVDKALGRADSLLYDAKQNGRNQVCWS